MLGWFLAMWMAITAQSGALGSMPHACVQLSAISQDKWDRLDSLSLLGMSSMPLQDVSRLPNRSLRIALMLQPSPLPGLKHVTPAHTGARRLRSAVEKTIRTERVSFVDLAQNPRLAARARAELDPLAFAAPGGDALGENSRVGRSRRHPSPPVLLSATPGTAPMAAASRMWGCLL